jgi:hypothetical protein
VFVAMGQYEWGDQVGHTNAAWHETVVLVGAIVEDVVVDDVAEVVADDVAQFEVDVADEHYCYQAPVVEQTAEVEKSQQQHEKTKVE